MLKLNEANPLSVFGLRRLEHCPPHFTVVDFDIKAPEKHISDWIWENLIGRFYFDNVYQTTSTELINKTSDNITICKRAAFEIPAEASYFSLILDTINQFEEVW
jgi:hypothetical protein